MIAALQPFVWTPSLQRTVALWDTAASAPGGHVAAFVPLRWPDKPAAAVQDFTLDATALLDPAGDVLAAEIEPLALSLLATVVLGGRVILWFGAGGAPFDYPVGITLTTQSTRVVRRIVRLRVY